MTLENCKICPYHYDFSQGQVHCRYWGTNINSVATYEDRGGAIKVIGCPAEKEK